MTSVLPLALAPTCRFDHTTAVSLRASLADLTRPGPLRARAVARLLADRAPLADEPGTDPRRVAFDGVVDADGTGVVFARGEVLLRGPGTAAARELLDRLGFAVLAERGQLLRLRKPTATADDVLAVCRALGVAAGPNHMVAAGMIRKGLVGHGAARPTDVMLGARPRDDRRGAGVRVAVVDSGIDRQAAAAAHGWLADIPVERGNVDLLDAVPVPDGYLDDGAGHGTFVAGVVRQVAPACDVVALRALESDGVGTEFALAECLMALATAERPPDVVNLSMACSVGEATSAVGVEAGLDALFEALPDVVVVAAAGNDGATTPVWPAADKRVVAVGACDGAQPAAYSNRGHWVDYAAPADGVVSTFVRGSRAASEDTPAAEFDGDYAAWSGTSFAAPQVAGVLAGMIGDGMAPRAALRELHRAAEYHGTGVGRTLAPRRS